MTSLKTVGVSDARKNMAGFFIEAVYKNQIVSLSRYEKEKAFLMGEKMLDLLLKPCLEKGKPELINEMDGTYTLIYDYLGLLTNQDTLQEAIEDIIDQAKEYAQDYLENIDVFQRDVERIDHLPLLLSIAKANNDSDIKKLLGLNY